MEYSSYSIINNITPTQYGDETVFETLLKEYERVIFESIIISFGLDLCIKRGGDVDTIHNAEKISFKNPQNEKVYNERGSYSHKDVEGKGTRYQKYKNEARKAYYKDGKTVQDAYEDKMLAFLGKSKGHPTDKSAELDHVISAKQIHDDRGRVLSGLSTKDLADSEENLQWTNEAINRSMGKDDILDYIKKHPELPEKTKDNLKKAYDRAKYAIDKKKERAYYFDFKNPQCRQFYKDTVFSAGKRGIEFGLREMLGCLFVEAFFIIKDEIKDCNKTFCGVIAAVHQGMKKWEKYVTDNKGQLLNIFSEGVLSGIFSSVISTLCNTFMTTSKNTEKVIRQAWAVIVEATGILIFNTREQLFCDRFTEAAKVLASGAAVIIGTTTQESVSIKLKAVPISDELKKIIATFIGCLCTGILAVSFLFYIDNDPFAHLIDYCAGCNLRNLQTQGELFKIYCAELEKIDIEKFDKETSYFSELADKLQEAVDDKELNCMLIQALDDLQITCLFKEGLDKLMNEPDFELVFNC